MDTKQQQQFMCAAVNQKPNQAIRSHFYKQNNYLGEEGKACILNSGSFAHGGVVLSQKGNSKGLDEKTEIPKGRGVNKFGILMAWGVMHFGISEGMGGLRYGSSPWLGMDIFWNCPITLIYQLLILRDRTLPWHKVSKEWQIFPSTLSLLFNISIFPRWNLFKLSYLVKMIRTNILLVKKYGVIQMVSLISRDFLFLAIKLNCSNRFSSKMDISKFAKF